ncbi:MAG TPA: CBS domain-containing protein, partial [Ramlibacter sp.]|nr:CBS domain-containing protein [Ramlibacter sp.]
MNAEQFQQLLVPLSMPWLDAAARMDEAAQGVLLAVDGDGRLRRTVTDGDLRRAMLQHRPDRQTLGELPAREPLVVGQSATMADVQRLLTAHAIAHVPVVGADGCPVDLITSRELSQRVWLSSPHLGEEETAFVEEAFRTNWIAPLGPHVDAFERELAAHV